VGRIEILLQHECCLPSDNWSRAILRIISPLAAVIESGTKAFRAYNRD